MTTMQTIREDVDAEAKQTISTTIDFAYDGSVATIWRMEGIDTTRPEAAHAIFSACDIVGRAIASKGLPIVLVRADGRLTTGKL